MEEEKEEEDDPISNSGENSSQIDRMSAAVYPTKFKISSRSYTMPIFNSINNLRATLKTIWPCIFLFEAEILMWSGLETAKSEING